MPDKMPQDRKGGVSGTVNAFNFIRRVGFPSTPRVIEIFAGIALLSASISLLPSNESLAQTLVFVGAILVWPAVLGEFLNAILILHMEKILDFRRLMGLEIISLFPVAVLLPLFSWVGLLVGQKTLWEYGFLVGLAGSFSCCLEETLSRAYNADSDYGVVSCRRLLCFTSYPTSDAASKGPDLASHLLSRVCPRSLFHHPSSGSVRKIRDRFFSYAAIQIVPSSLVA